MPNPQPQDGAALLAKIKPRLAEDWYEVCLRPDLNAAFEEAYSDYLESKAADAQRTSTVGSKGTSAETTRRKKAAEKLREQMIDAAVTFKFRGRDRDEFRALCDEHAPREGDQYDAFVGYNRQAVSDALVRASLVDPVFEDCTDAKCKHFNPQTGEGCGTWQHMVKVVGPGQWDKLRETAEKVNGAVVKAPPKALLA